MKVQGNHLHGTLYVLGLAVILISGVFACNDINVTGNGGKGHINLYLTDAPAEYQEVNIDVQGVRIRYQAAGDTAQADTADAGDGEAQWMDLPVEPFRINLLDLTNSDTLLAAADDLPAGRYNELRLILGEDNEVVIDSVSHKLTTPSAQQSGYKIKFGTWLDSGEEMNLTVDFDAKKSIVETGNGKYMLKPVLKAFEGRVDTTDG